MPSYISGVTIFGEFLFVCLFFLCICGRLKSNQRSNYILPSRKVQAGCAFVAGIHLSRTCMSGSFESRAMECMCAQTRPRLYSHSKEFLRDGVRTCVNSKGKNPLYRKLRGGLNPRLCTTQDKEPNTLPTELFRPPDGYTNRR